MWDIFLNKILNFGVYNLLDFIIECTLVVNYLGCIYEKFCIYDLYYKCIYEKEFSMIILIFNRVICVIYMERRGRLF